MLRSLKGEKVWLTVISAGRFSRVQDMTNLIGPCTWYVPEEEQTAYLEHGAALVAEGSNQNVVHARNRALIDAWAENIPCIQLDDDLKWVKEVVQDEEGKNIGQRMSAEEMCGRVAKMTRESGYRLGGCAPTNNPYFTRSDVQTRCFVRSPVWCVLPNELLLDESLPVKFDYDYTLQHLRRYGGVCRVDKFVCEFDFKTLPGGHVDTRTDDMNERCIRRLEEKWGTKVIRRNPRRPGEILLRPPKPQRTVMA